MGKRLGFVLASAASLASVSWLALEVARFRMPTPLACADARPGLWLTLPGDRPLLTGLAPPGAAALAVIVAVDHWGYPHNAVCAERAATSPAWTTVVQAVYRAPLSALRRGTVLTRPDLVVVAGEVRSRATRLSLERELRQSLADAGLGTLPLLYEVTVAADPSLAPRLAGLSLRFESGSALLSQEARRVLAVVIDDLRASEGVIVVAGHADASGRAAYNEALARRRAEAIRDYLAGAGVPRDRMRAVGFGARLPAADGATAEARAANRRVELRVVAE